MSSTASSCIAEKNNAQALSFSKKAIFSLCVVVAAAIIAVYLTPASSLAGQPNVGFQPCAPTLLNEQSCFNFNANANLLGVDINAGGGAGGSSLSLNIGKKKSKKTVDINAGGGVGGSSMNLKFGKNKTKKPKIPAVKVATIIIEEPPTFKVEKETFTTTTTVPEQETVVPLQYGFDPQDPYDREKLNDRIFLGKALAWGMFCLFFLFAMCTMGPTNGQIFDPKFPIWYSILMPVACAGCHFPGVWFCWKTRHNNSTASDLDNLIREAEPERTEVEVTERTVLTKVPGKKKKKKTTIVAPTVEVPTIGMTVSAPDMSVSTPGMTVSASGTTVSAPGMSMSVSTGGMSVSTSTPAMSMSIDGGMNVGADFDTSFDMMG